MPIDRIIHRTDPNLQRVQESADRGGRGQQQPSEEKEKDKFDKKQPLWKRVFSSGSGSTSPSSILARKPRRPVAPRLEQHGVEEEKSFTLTERLLVLWGILEKDGRPRPLIILIYTLILGMIVGATLLIVGMTLWHQ